MVSDTGSFRIFALAAALGLVGPAHALAGDMPEIPPVEDAGGEPELGSNWYLRGDVGYTLWQNPGVNGRWTSPIEAPSSNVSLDGTWSAGLGAGYDFGGARVDLTVDYIGRQNVEVGFGAFDCDLGAGGATCLGQAKSSVSAIPILLNAYADLGNWGGFKPYIGAGLGVARVDWGRWDTQVACAENGGTCPLPPGGDAAIDFSNEGATTWNFAWALMAGISYSVNQNLSLDLGYRFLDIADGKAGRNHAYPTDPVTPLGDVQYKDLYAHEIRLGFRYLVD